MNALQVDIISGKTICRIWYQNYIIYGSTTTNFENWRFLFLKTFISHVSGIIQ